MSRRCVTHHACECQRRRLNATETYLAELVIVLNIIARMPAKDGRALLIEALETRGLLEKNEPAKCPRCGEGEDGLFNGSCCNCCGWPIEVHPLRA